MVQAGSKQVVQTTTQPRSRASKAPVNRAPIRASVTTMLEGRDADSDVATMTSRSLLSTMAHEIRGPLSAVALSSELLLDDVDGLRPEQIRSLAQRIHRGTLWLQGLIENILCDAALKDGRFEL